MPSPKVPSAKLLARRVAKVVMNYEALDAMERGMADGLLAMGQAMLEDARPHVPDQPPYGVGLVEMGGVVVFVRGKKVGGDGDKPKRLRLPADQVVMAVGYGGRVGHLQELGTINMPAHPFLLPAFNRGLPGSERYILPAMGKRLRAMPNKVNPAARAVAATFGIKL